jgi:tRNA(fMet)-specific endonuclease VapC
LLDAFLDVSNPPLAFETNDATAAAHIRAVLEAMCQSIGPVDILLAGQAVARGADLVTSNLVEFKRVPGLRVAVAERSWIAR